MGSGSSPNRPGFVRDHCRAHADFISDIDDHEIVTDFHWAIIVFPDLVKCRADHIFVVVHVIDHRHARIGLSKNFSRFARGRVIDL